MGSGITMQLVFSIAFEEMAAEGGNEIEPKHLLAASLKFIELDAAFLKKVVQPQKTVELVIDLQNNARKILENIGIDVPTGSARIRKILRKSKKDSRRSTIYYNTVHRSKESLILCQSAKKHAIDSGSRYYEVEHLFWAFIDYIKYSSVNKNAHHGKKLINSSAKKNEEVRDSLVNLTSLAKEGKLQGSSVGGDPIAKSLLRILQDSKRNKKHILLINYRNETVMPIWEDLAIHSVQSDKLSGYKEKKIKLYILDLEKQAYSHEDFQQTLKFLQKESKPFEKTAICCSISKNIRSRKSEIFNYCDQVAILAENCATTIILAMPHAMFEPQIKKGEWHNEKFFIVWAHDLTAMTD